MIKTKVLALCILMILWTPTLKRGEDWRYPCSLRCNGKMRKHVLHLGCWWQYFFICLLILTFSYMFMQQAIEWTVSNMYPCITMGLVFAIFPKNIITLWCWDVTKSKVTNGSWSSYTNGGMGSEWGFVLCIYIYRLDSIHVCIDKRAYPRKKSYPYIYIYIEKGFCTSIGGGFLWGTLS